MNGRTVVGLFAVCCAAAVATVRAEPKDIVVIGEAYSGERDVNKRPVLKRLIEGGGWGSFKLVIGLDNLTKADLAAAKVLIVGSGAKHYALDAHDREALKAIVEYARAGGGVIIPNGYGQMWAHTEFCYQLMKAFGGEVAMAAPVFPKESQHRIGDYGPDMWAYTDRVFPPFDEGVKTVLVRSYYQFNCDHGVVPFYPNADWKVALTAGRDIAAKPFPKMGLDFLDARLREKGFDGDTPIVGYREFGKGRVVWFGASTLLCRTNPSEAIREISDRILEKGPEGGHPVETGRFCCNVLNWAGAHAAQLDAAAIPGLKSRAADEARLGKAFRFFRGAVGPRTTHSSGKSTTAEYIAKAKALGHDFIVFLEDLEHLSAGEFEKLRAECAAATDNTFTAWPGFTYRKDNGNCQYVFSNEPIYPGDYFLDGNRRFRSLTHDTPERGYNPKSDVNFSGGTDLEYLYGRLSFVNNAGWYMFHDSPYRQTDNRNVQSMGVITRQNGLLVENAFDAYRINTRNGQALMPLALELMTSADALNEDTLLSSIGIEGLAAFRRLMMSHGSHSGYPGEGIYGQQGVSNGPELNFRPARGDYSGDDDLLYCKDFSHWPYTLEVSSPNGIDTVEIVDADRVVRRWKANGAKTFERTGAFGLERQHYLWARVTDCAGKKAFSRACGSETFLLRESICNDRNNFLFYSHQRRKGGEEAGAYHSQFGADCAIPDKGPWHGRMRPVGFFVFDKKYGLGGDGGHDGSPEDHPAMALTPSVCYGGAEPQKLGWVKEFVAGKEGGPHCRPERVVASSDALVADTVLDGVFAPDRRPVIHVWHSLFPVFDSQYADTRARNTIFIPKLDGVIPYQWEQSLTLREPVPSAAGRPIVRFGGVRFSTLGRETAAFVDGAWTKGIVNGRFSMKPGDFLVVKNPKFGSLAVYPLAPLDYVQGSLTVPGDGSTYPAGTTFGCRLVAMGFHKFTSDPFAAARAAANAYGIGGREPAYRVKLTAGRGQPNGVCFDAVAKDGALAGRFEDLAKLPGTLGLRLAGLNDNWAAVVSSKTGVRLVPVEKGVAYAALRDEESDCDLFVGHPVKASDPKLVLSLTRKGDAPWTLEVHNPTAKPVKAKLTTDPAFAAFRLAEDVEIAPGASVDIEPQEMGVLNP